MTDDPPIIKRNFLVWEGHEMPIPETGGPGIRHGVPPTVSRYVTEFNTVPFAVSAVDENAACVSVMRRTRRVSKYAVCEVTMVDFTFALGEDDEPEPERGRLNAGDTPS